MSIRLKIFQSLFKINVVSSIPGRLRLKIPKYAEFLKQLNLRDEDVVNSIKLINGIYSVEANIITEKILILYDFNVLNEVKIVTAINNVIRNVIVYMDKTNQSNIKSSQLMQIVKETIGNRI